MQRARHAHSILAAPSAAADICMCVCVPALTLPYLSAFLPPDRSTGVQASCGEAYGKVFSDTAPEAWCVLGYEGQKVVAQECGEGGLDDCAAKFDDVQVQYAFVRLERSDDGGKSIIVEREWPALEMPCRCIVLPDSVC